MASTPKTIEVRATGIFVKLAKRNIKALKAVRKGLEGLADAYDAHALDQEQQTRHLVAIRRIVEHLQTGIESRTLNELRDLKRLIGGDSASMAGLMAKLDKLFPEVQGAQAAANKVRADIFDLAGRVKGQGFSISEGLEIAKALRSDVGTLRSQMTEAIDYLRFGYKDNAAALHALSLGQGRPESSLRPALAEIRDAIRQQSSDAVDLAAEASDDIKQAIANQGFETRTQLGDLVAGLSGKLTADYLTQMERINTRADEVKDQVETNYQAITAHLATLESKIDAISVSLEDHKEQAGHS